jgi:hypothetical protein
LRPQSGGGTTVAATLARRGGLPASSPIRTSSSVGRDAAFIAEHALGNRAAALAA